MAAELKIVISDEGDLPNAPVADPGIPADLPPTPIPPANLPEPPTAPPPTPPAVQETPPTETLAAEPPAPAILNGLAKEEPLHEEEDQDALAQDVLAEDRARGRDIERAAQSLQAIEKALVAAEQVERAEVAEPLADRLAQEKERLTELATPSGDKPRQVGAAGSSDKTLSSEPAPKEQWQMTRQEHRLYAQPDKENPEGGYRIAGDDGEWFKSRGEADKFLDQEHRAWVKHALEEGKPVPPEVLADYPALAKKYPAIHLPSPVVGPTPEVAAPKVPGPVRMPAPLAAQAPDVLPGRPPAPVQLPSPLHATEPMPETRQSPVAVGPVPLQEGMTRLDFAKRQHAIEKEAGLAALDWPSDPELEEEMVALYGAGFDAAMKQVVQERAPEHSEQRRRRKKRQDAPTEPARPSEDIAEPIAQEPVTTIAASEGSAPPERPASVLEPVQWPDHPAARKVREGIDQANLPDDQKAEFARVSAEVLRSMPAQALDRVATNLQKASFYADSKTMALAALDRMPPSPAVDDIRKRVEQGEIAPSGGYDRLHEELYLAPPAPVEGTGLASGRYPHKGGDAREAYGHEIGHVVDGPKHELSDMPGWQEAWQSEIAGFGGDAKLTEYAAENPKEAFAEFARLVYAGGDLAAVEKDFSRAAAFFKEKQLWPEGPRPEDAHLEELERKSARKQKRAAPNKVYQQEAPSFAESIEAAPTAELPALKAPTAEFLPDAPIQPEIEPPGAPAEGMSASLFEPGTTAEASAQQSIATGDYQRPVPAETVPKTPETDAPAPISPRAREAVASAIRLDSTPTSSEPGAVYNIPLAEIRPDRERFQYKQSSRAAPAEREKSKDAPRSIENVGAAIDREAADQGTAGPAVQGSPPARRDRAGQSSAPAGERQRPEAQPDGLKQEPTPPASLEAAPSLPEIVRPSLPGAEAPAEVPPPKSTAPTEGLPLLVDAPASSRDLTQEQAAARNGIAPSQPVGLEPPGSAEFSHKAPPTFTSPDAEPAPRVQEPPTAAAPVEIAAELPNIAKEGRSDNAGAILQTTNAARLKLGRPRERSASDIVEPAQTLPDRIAPRPLETQAESPGRDGLTATPLEATDKIAQMHAAKPERPLSERERAVIHVQSVKHPYVPASPFFREGENRTFEKLEVGVNPQAASTNSDDREELYQPEDVFARTPAHPKEPVRHDPTAAVGRPPERADGLVADQTGATQGVVDPGIRPDRERVAFEGPAAPPVVQADALGGLFDSEVAADGPIAQPVAQDAPGALFETEYAVQTPPEQQAGAPSEGPLAEQPIKLDRAPEQPIPNRVYSVPLKDIHRDPERFQYKSGTNKKGVTDQFAGVEYKPELGGLLSVWKDPSDDQTYAINGHHRLELAERSGNVSHLPVQYIQAKDAAEARGTGALINIADGKGTAMDAAKFMRDAHASPEDLAKRGVSLKQKTVSDATALATLNDRLFAKVARGQMPEEKAIAIAKHLPDHHLQDQLAQFLVKKEESGKEYAPKIVEDMAREMAATPKHTTSEHTLFGDIESEDSLFGERNELKAAVRTELAKSVNDFKAVASERRAEVVSAAGNSLDVAANKKRVDENTEMLGVYDRLVNSKGPISDALNEGAAEYASATGRKQKDDVRTRTIERVREAIAREASNGGAVGSPVRASTPTRRDGESQLPARTPEPERREVEPDGLTPEVGLPDTVRPVQAELIAEPPSPAIEQAVTVPQPSLAERQPGLSEDDVRGFQAWQQTQDTSRVEVQAAQQRIEGEQLAAEPGAERPGAQHQASRTGTFAPPVETQAVEPIADHERPPHTEHGGERAHKQPVVARQEVTAEEHMVRGALAELGYLDDYPRGAAQTDAALALQSLPPDNSRAATREIESSVVNQSNPSAPQKRESAPPESARALTQVSEQESKARQKLIDQGHTPESLKGAEGYVKDLGSTANVEREIAVESIPPDIAAYLRVISHRVHDAPTIKEQESPAPSRSSVEPAPAVEPGALPRTAPAQVSTHLPDVTPPDSVMLGEQRVRWQELPPAAQEVVMQNLREEAAAAKTQSTKLMARPPESAQLAQQVNVSSEGQTTVQRDLFGQEVEPPTTQKARERLEKRTEQQAIEQEMRALDEDYRAEQELRDAYLENAKAIRELTEQAKTEKLLLAAMTPEERVDYLARKKAEDQVESQAIKEKADELVYGPEHIQRERVLREHTEQARIEKLALMQMTPEERVEHEARQEIEKRVEREKVKERVKELTAQPEQAPEPQFDPYAEAEKQHQQNLRREQVKAAYDERYGQADQQPSALDAGLDLAQQIRGVLGGAFGPMAGAVLDLVSAVRKAQPEGKSELRQEAERRNAELSAPPEDVPFVTAAPEPDDFIQEVQPLPTALAAPVAPSVAGPDELIASMEAAAPAHAERVEQTGAYSQVPSEPSSVKQQSEWDQLLPSEKAFVEGDLDTNASPVAKWESLPAETQSFIMNDVDAQSPLTGLPEIPSQSSATPAARPQRSAGSLLGRERAPSVQRELGAGEPAPSSYLMGSARPEAQSPRDANLPAPPTSPVAAAEAGVPPPANESQEISAKRDRESPASLDLPDISSQPAASPAKADLPLSGPLPKSAPVEKAPTTNPASAAMQAPKAPPAGVAAPASRAAAQGVASTASSAASSGVAASGTTSAATAAAGAAGGAAGGGAAAGGAAAGAAGAGGMAAAGLAAAAGPAAVVVAAVVALQQVRDAAMGAVAGMGDMAASMASFKDGSEGVYRLGEATKSASEKLFWVSPAVGIFGSVVGESITSVGKLDDAVKATSQRLGQYHAGLATQNAQQEARETMRDINRANRFGQVTAGANDARFSMEQKLADIADRFVPFVMKIGEAIFKLLEQGLTIVDDGFKMVLRAAEGVLALLEQVVRRFGNIGQVGTVIADIRRLISTALEDNNNTDEQQQWNAFLRSANHLTGTINQMAPAPGAGIQAVQAPF